MTIVEKRMKVTQVDKGCDVCHTGLMRPTGMRVSSQTKYTHACTVCGHRTTYPVTYPYLEHSPAVEVEVKQSSKEDYVGFLWLIVFIILVIAVVVS